MAEQLERLRGLLRAILPANRFYASRLREAGVDAEFDSLAEFCARVPFTTKGDLAADHLAHPPYGSNLTAPIECYTRFCQTSGTTGRPLVILDTAESWDWLLGNWTQIYRAAGVAAGDRIYFAFSFGPFLGFWTAFEAAARLGFLCIPGGGLGTAARLRAIIEHRATVLCCTPTYALHLGEVAAREGIDLRESVLRKIIVAGEAGGSVREVRAKMSAAWNGAEVLDHYGMTEVGPVAFQPREGALQIIDDSYFAEIVDPQSGAAVPDGEMGELILTTLGRTACPLLRYRTGDLVKRMSNEPGFILDGGILGRSDDMIVVRGVNLFPSGVDAVLRRVAEIGEYRVTVSRRGALVEISIEVETTDGDVTRKVEHALSSAFSLRIPVRRVEPGSLPRFEMKARRWVTGSAE
jgi:phenylacetate-CoA ligase